MLKSLTRLFTPKNFSLFFLALILVGLFTTQVARAFLSIALGGFFICTLFNIQSFSFKASKINLSLLVFCGVYLLHLTHIFCTESVNINHFLSVLFMKLPLLLLPIGFILMPGLSKKEFHTLLYLFFIATVITALGSVVNYIFNFEEINFLYLTSKTLPVAANHVRYSLMLATAICSGAYLFISKFSMGWWKHERTLLIFLVIFLFAFAHLLAVRSGLVALYATCFIAGIAGVLSSKRKKNAIILLSILLILPIIGAVTIPTIRNKVENTIADFSHINDVYSANYHSITARVLSYQVAWELFEKNPLFGVGIGNLHREVELQYIRNYQIIKQDKWLIPHNQYLLCLTAFGIVGTVAFLFFFYFPLFHLNNWKKDIFFSFQYLIISISFLVEGTLETQLGLAYAAIFILMALSYLKWKRANELS